MKELSLFTLAAVAAFTAHSQNLVLTNVNIVPMTEQKLLRSQTVYIEDGRIVRISDRVEPPADKTPVVECGGKYLIPGLWDMHVHLTDATEIALPALVANGVTGVRDMGGDLALIDRWRSEIAEGDHIGPRIVRPGPYVDGFKEGIPYRRTVATADEGRAAVRDLAAMGVDFLKVHNAVPREAYFALAEEARGLGLRFSGHIPKEVTPTEAVNAGQNSIEHTETLIEGTLQQTFREQRLGMMRGLEQYVNEGAPELFRLMADKEVAYCPILIAYYESARRSIVEENPDSRANYVAASLQAQWLAYFSTRPRTIEKIRMRILGSFKELVREMNEAGVLILAGSDLAGRNLYPGFSLHDELGLLVESGLTPKQALQAATINAARHLKLQDQSGSLEAGKWADMVLLESNPLTDIENTKSITAVVTRGHYLPREELDAMLARVKELAPSN